MPADGYTIVGINLPHIILQPLRGAKYKTRDIAAVSIFHYTPHALIARADSRPKTFNDLMEEIAKRRVTFSGSGTGSANHLAQVQFDRLKGIKTAYKPYKGTAASVQALLRGKVDAAWGYTTVGAKYRGDVRMLAVAMEERHPEFPDVPTFKELGIDMVGGAYRGVAVPKNTPEAVRKHLSTLIRDITYDADYEAEQTKLGFVPLDVPYEDVAAFIRDRIAEFVPLARAAGLVK
jgi:tripartite-type tricarboxylate transporter receptor subunit TctC